MHGALWEQAANAPFALYGLTSDFEGSRMLAAVGHHGDVVNLVELGHGNRWSAPFVWVQVAVFGPLHGAPSGDRALGLPGGEWSADPLPMIANQVLDLAGARFATGEEVQLAIHELVADGFGEERLLLDRRAQPFRTVVAGNAWAAMRDLEPDHLLYVIATNISPADIAIRKLDDIEAYTSTDV